MHGRRVVRLRRTQVRRAGKKMRKPHPPIGGKKARIHKAGNKKGRVIFDSAFFVSLEPSLSQSEESYEVVFIFDVSSYLCGTHLSDFSKIYLAIDVALTF